MFICQLPFMELDNSAIAAAAGQPPFENGKFLCFGFYRRFDAILVDYLESLSMGILKG